MKRIKNKEVDEIRGNYNKALDEVWEAMDNINKYQAWINEERLRLAKLNRKCVLLDHAIWLARRKFIERGGEKIKKGKQAAKKN